MPRIKGKTCNVEWKTHNMYHVYAFEELVNARWCA